MPRRTRSPSWSTLEAEACRQGWDHAAFLAAAGRTVHAIVRRERPVAEQLAEDLVVRAEAVDAPALRGSRWHCGR